MQKLAVVYFPKVNLDQINLFRKKYDPLWEIIPPHITLVAPVDISEKQLFQHLEKVAQKLSAFSIILNGLTKADDDYLFLNQLYTGILASYHPSSFVPHLTLGKFSEEAYQEAQELNLNIECNFDNLTLIKGDEISPAQIIKIFKLK